jgi:NitT/TauT family transport system substrate-binding protein
MTLGAVVRRAAAAAVACFVLSSGTLAQDKVNVGKAVLTSFAFATLDVGVKAGTFKSENLDVTIQAFNGDAQMQQALTAGTIDFGFGSGPAMAYIAKGVPIQAVAAFAGKPVNMCIVVVPNKFKSADDLAGQKFGVTTAGSLTYWLVKEMSRQKGWTGDKAMIPVPLGSMRTRLAAMKTGEIQGTVQETPNGYEIESKGDGKVFVTFGDIAPHFHTHVVFATNKIAAERPQVVERFLRGLFKTVKYMAEHRAETVAIVADVIKVDPKIADQSYPTLMDFLSKDGAFDKEALEVIRRSLLELKILESLPDMKPLYTEKYVPVKL